MSSVMNMSSKMSTITNNKSPLKMTAEKMQMVRRDVKPGNGTSLLTYQNHANHTRHLVEMKHLVDDRPSENYLKEKILGPERYAHTRHRQMEELRKENNRLFGRLLNIYEKKPPLVKEHRPGSLAVTKNKLMNAKITQENVVLGAKLINTISDVPD